MSRPDSAGKSRIAGASARDARQIVRRPIDDLPGDTAPILVGGIDDARHVVARGGCLASEDTFPKIL